MSNVSGDLFYLCRSSYFNLETTGVTAQTSLYIPGFDPQPISADIMGVDSEGRTTWALHKGAATGTTDDGSDFVGTGVFASIFSTGGVSVSDSYPGFPSNVRHSYLS